MLGYCLWRQKPVQSNLLTSVCLNLITQSLLWLVLNVFFQHYLVVLLVAEIFVEVIEGLALYYVPSNHLLFIEAISLSLGMNLVSFALGWVLPV